MPRGRHFGFLDGTIMIGIELEEELSQLDRLRTGRLGQSHSHQAQRRYQGDTIRPE